MKKSLLVLIAASLIFALSAITIFSSNKQEGKSKKSKQKAHLILKKNPKVQKTNSRNKKVSRLQSRQVPEEINEIKREIVENSSKKKKDDEIEDDDKKFDKPDKFVEYENSIRTARGMKAPNYPLNYKLTELNKALESKLGINLNSYNSSFRKLQSSGLPWLERGPGNISGRTRAIIVDPDNPIGSTWFVGSVGGGIWKTTNAGSSWSNKTPTLPNLATTSLAMAPSNHNIIYAGTGEGFYNVDAIGGDGILKSIDHGETWNQLPSTSNSLNFQDINRIIVSPLDANILYTCTNVGFDSQNLGYSSGIFKSTDGGNSWIKLYTSEKRIQQIIANPQNFNTLYAAVNSIGVIKSVDGGLTWDTTQGIITTGRVEIAIAPSDTTRMYASVEFSSGSDLYLSNDAGANWNLVNDLTGTNPDWLGGQGWYGNALAVHPYGKDTLFVGGVDIYKINLVPGIDSVTQLSTVNSNTQGFLSFVDWGGSMLSGGAGTGKEFLGENSVVDSDYVSIEVRFGPGISQKAHRFIRSFSGIYVYKDYTTVPFQVWDVKHNYQLMVSYRDWDTSGVFKLIPYDVKNTQRDYIFINSVPYDANNPSTNITSNSGMKFKNIYALWPILSDGAVWNPNNLPVSKLSINNKTVVALRHSTEQITDWHSRVSSSYIHADQHNITIIPINRLSNRFRILNSNDGGVSISNDGGNNWTQITNYQTTQFYGVDKNPLADQYIGGMQDNGTALSNINPAADSSFQSVLSGDGFTVGWKYDDQKKLFATIYNNLIYKSVNGGRSWSSGTDGLFDANNSINSPFITNVAKSNQDPDLLFTVSSLGVWRSDNFANSWTLTEIPPGWGYNSLLTQINISLSNPQIVWAGGYLDSNDNLRVSTDGGVSFNPTNTFNVGKADELSGFATDPNNDSTAYALFSVSQSPKIVKTTDLGKTWNDISGFGTGTVSTNGFPDVATNCLLVMPNHPDTIWVGTEIGLFQSTNGGGSWQIADNGLPAVSIWSMRIVGDQVVAATHGRGIWSVKVPWLSDYILKPAVKSPRLNSLTQGQNGELLISYSLRSGYDSTKVFLNGKLIAKLGMNISENDTSFMSPVIAISVDTVQIISYKSGIQFKSSAQLIRVNLNAATLSYVNNFNSATNDFYGKGFTISTVPGFSSSAIHSTHPYGDNTNNTFELLKPITVASSNAILSYDDIAIVEPGENGSVFGDTNFYDYVVVEGSTDGSSWIPLAPGYNCRSNVLWLNAWNSNAGGDSTMFIHHDLDLSKTFSPGNNILIRFRLFANGAKHGWGWAIDNLSIQRNATSVVKIVNVLPKDFGLAQNYPNPFNPTTTINFQIPHKERVTLIIYNSVGQKIKTLLSEFKDAGYYHILWNGENEQNKSVASGIYLYRIEAGSFIETKKMILLK